MSDKGTLSQLKYLINRTSVPKDPEKNMQAAEDFFRLVLEAHIVAAAEKELLNDDCTVKSVAEAIVESHIHLEPNEASHADTVNTYACELMTLGMIWLNYYDAIREGDGHRIIRIWKFLLLIFRKTGHRNYAKEAGLLLSTITFTASERVAAQILTGRFINTKGRIGCNLPCDLHLEHLNRCLKRIIRHLGSNVKPSTVARAAKAVGTVESICKTFTESLGVSAQSTSHSIPPSGKDFKKVLQELIEHDIFSSITSRKHNHIKLKNCLLETTDYDKITDWLINNIIPCVIF